MGLSLSVLRVCPHERLFRLQALADLPKGVERNGVSMNFPVVVERELRSSRSAGLSHVET